MDLPTKQTLILYYHLISLLGCGGTLKISFERGGCPESPAESQGRWWRTARADIPGYSYPDADKGAWRQMGNFPLPAPVCSRAPPPSPPVLKYSELLLCIIKMLPCFIPEMATAHRRQAASPGCKALCDLKKEKGGNKKKRRKEHCVHKIQSVIKYSQL